MKTTRILRSCLVAILATFAACFHTGCASGIISAATTKVEVQAGDKTVSVSLPKELDATKLDLSVNPVTGVYSLRADRLKSSSQHVIDSAGAAQAEALAELSATVRQLVPLVAPQLRPVPPINPDPKTN